MKTSASTSRRNFIKTGAALAAGAAVIPALAHADSSGDAIGKLFGSGDDTDDTNASTQDAATDVNYSELFEAALKANDLMYTRRNERLIQVQFEGDNFDDIDIRVAFDEDNEPYVHFFCWTMGNVSTSAFQSVLSACNTMNDAYYWAKFYIDSDSDITVEASAIVTPQSAEEELIDLLLRLATIIDDAYPQMAAALQGTFVSA